MDRTDLLSGPEGRRLVTDDERTIIVTADLHDVGGALTVDLGSLAPHLAASILRAAADDLERFEPIVTVVHEGEPLWAYSGDDDEG